jgi:hypothetical protein
MITRERFDLIKQNWGELASWAVWAEMGDTPRTNIGDLTIFEREEILRDLKPEILFVGLNISRDDLKDRGPFANFHSNYGHAQEYKLRQVLKGTRLWGGYLTDIIKDYPDINSSNVLKKLKEDPSIEIENVQRFKREINDLGVEDPTIIALGGASYKILLRNFRHLKVFKMTHFSARIKLEKYKSEVEELCSTSNILL